MSERLQTVLVGYIRENNPDLLFQLEEDNRLHEWVHEKVSSVSHIGDEMICLQTMTADIRPSKFNYIKDILEDEFPKDFQRLHDTGVLTFEIINMIDSCKDVFAEIPLTDENEDDSMLRYAVTGVLSDYLQGVLS